MNKKNKITFREQLLAQGNNDTRLQSKFNQEIKKMYTENLKRRQRFAHVLVSILFAFLALLFWVFSKVFEELQMENKIAFMEPLRLFAVWIMFLSIALMVLCIWPAFIGKIGLRVYPKVVRLVSWVIIIAIIIFSLLVFDFMDNHMDVEFSPPNVAYGFVALILILVIGVHLLLSVRIDSIDLKNKEKSLELECRLIELERKLHN